MGRRDVFTHQVEHIMTYTLSMWHIYDGDLKAISDELGNPKSEDVFAIDIREKHKEWGFESPAQTLGFVMASSIQRLERPYSVTYI